MYERDKILHDLREHVIEVTFKKVDGVTRMIRCTLMPEHLPPSYTNNLEEQNTEKEFHLTNPHVIAAWDVQRGGWLSFRMETISYVQIIDGY